MARKAIKTMADKMAESGKGAGINVLDDTDLATDPIVSALQTLRLTIDDMQYNDANHGTDKQTSLISANTAKTGITSTQAGHITANNAKVSTGEDLIPGTDGGKLIASVAESRGTYTLTFKFTSADGRTIKKANVTMS
jgi:hypothetical protein